MKKTLPAALLFLCTASGFAQESQKEYGFVKGDLFTSLTGNFGYQKNTYIKNNWYSITPSVNYMATDHIALTGVLEYFWQKNTTLGISEIVSKHHEYSVTMAGKYYINPQSQFAVYGMLLTRFTNSRHRSNITTMEQQIHQNLIHTAAGVGANYFLTSNISLQLELHPVRYTHYMVKSPVADNVQDIFFVGIHSTDVAYGIAYKF